MNVKMSAPRESSGARSLRRAIDILGLLEGSGRELSAAEIVSSLNLPRSTAYEILTVLLEANLLRQSKQGAKFTLGRRLFELGMHYREQDRLLQEGSRVLTTLRDVTGETVQLSVLDGDRVNIVLKEEGKRAVRIISNVGSRVPVNWSAAGRLLVSDLSDTELRDFLQRTVSPSPTNLAEMDIDTLITQIREYRARGYSIEINQANEHAGCIAAAVLDDDGRCIAAVSLAVPESRLRSDDFESLKKEVTAAAAALSVALAA